MAVGDSVFSDNSQLDEQDDGRENDGLTTREMLTRIFTDYLKPRQKLLIGSLAAMTVVAVTTALIPVLIKQATDTLLQGSSGAHFYWLPISLVVISTFKAVSDFFVNVARNYLGLRAVADIQTSLFKKLMITDISELSQTHSGQFVASFLNDATRIRDTVGMIVAFAKNSMIVSAMLVAMYWIEWRMALIVTLILPVMLYFMGRQRRVMRKSTTQSLQQTSEFTTIISETLSGIRVVKAYGQEEYESKRAETAINRNLTYLMRAVRARAASAPIAEALSGVIVAAVILYASRQTSFDTSYAGTFTSFMAAITFMYQPLKALATTQTALQEGVAAAARIFSLMDKKVGIIDLPNTPELTASKGDIEFSNVDFSYRDGTPVLKNFSLRVPAGKRVALVGPSGAGKSTVINLVLRFFEAQSGTILIDGQDITQTSLKSLRQATALVNQDPFLFDDSIFANISYGTAHASDADIKRAAIRAGANGFITALPQGYETNVGEGGGLLSGGEKQRLVIARALLKDARILLLDEATSSLDAQAEEHVQSVLDNLDNGHTVLMIAHRLSSVRNADIICVMDKGEVVETGNHDELLAHGGLYKQLYATQFAESDAVPAPQT